MRNLVPAILLLAGLTLGVCALFPGFLLARALSTVLLVAQITAFPFVVGVLASVVGIGLGWVSIRRKWARTWLSIGVAWLVAGVCFWTFPAGIAALPADRNSAGRAIRVVTFNTQSKLTGTDIQQLVGQFDPDVMVFPETSDVELKSVLSRLSFPGAVYATPDSGLTSSYSGELGLTSLVVNNRLGAAKPIAGPPTSFGTVALTFDDASLPTIVGVHTAPPLPGLMHNWRDDLERVVNFGAQFDGKLIVAGDFNATLRHGAMTSRSNLIDAAQQCGIARTGTWPAGSPSLLRAPIDHILLSPSLAATGCQVLPLGTSDHRALVATVTV